MLKEHICNMYIQAVKNEIKGEITGSVKGRNPRLYAEAPDFSNMIPACT